jgi:hypothetical protein
MSKLRFNIGDVVYHASYGTSARKVECPHCLGTGRVRIIFADDAEASIGCGNCAHGFNPPSGEVTIWEGHAVVQTRIVSGFTQSHEGIEWSLDALGGCAWIGNDEDIFETKEEADARAAVLAAEATKYNEDKIYKKEKDTRSWAWNASYHRAEIKRAKQQIEYHEKKLAVASLKAKEQKTTARAALEGKND